MLSINPVDGTNAECNPPLSNPPSDLKIQLIQGNKSAENYSLLLDKIGGSARYQKILFGILSHQWQITSLIFTAAVIWLQPPEFLCGDGHPCPEELACNQQPVRLDMRGFRTITTSLGLYCDHRAERAWCQSILFVGAFFGELVVPSITDRFGRKRLCLAANGIGFLATLAINFSYSYLQFLVAGFLAGFFLWPNQSISYTIISESSGDRFRQKAVMGCLIY